VTPIDLVLLCGFLGSGKTTLLLHYLKHEANAEHTAIIVNDAGEINVDGAIIRSEALPLQLALLNNGCVCCSTIGELTLTIEELIRTRAQLPLPPLRRIIVETSGLSKPGPLLRQVASLAAHPLRARVLCTWDCMRSDAISEFEEVQAQVAGAHRIILTKRDLAGPTAVSRATGLLRSMNPLASVDHEAPPEEALALGLQHTVDSPEPSWLPFSVEKQAPHPRITVWNHRFEGSVDWQEMTEWLDNLAAAAGEKLLRVKGLIRVHDSAELILVQGVGSVFTMPRRVSVTVPPFLVVIARDFDSDAIETSAPRPVEVGFVMLEESTRDSRSMLSTATR
jgi:G3E family GTPase